MLEPFSSYRCLTKWSEERKKEREKEREKERKKERKRERKKERKKERITKMALLLPHTFLFNCLPRGCWPLI